MNKEIVHEVFRDLHLKKNESDPYYAKFCCFFILKVPVYAIPEGFCFQELFQYIFAALSSHWAIFTDLLKNITSVFYSLCFKGIFLISFLLTSQTATTTHNIHIIDIVDQLGDLAYTHLNDVEQILIKILQGSKSSPDLNKSLGEFMELHHLISCIISFPLKITKEQNGKGISNDSEAVLIQRMYCRNCGTKRQKIRREGVDNCKFCGMFIEDYIFKDYTIKMVNSGRLNSKALEKIKAASAKIEHIFDQKEVALASQYESLNNLWNLFTNYDFIIVQIMDGLREFYSII